MNSKFSFSRVWQLLRTDVIGNPRYYSRHALSLLLAQVLIIILPNLGVLLSAGVGDMSAPALWKCGTAELLAFGFFFYIFLMVSAVCRPMRSKMQRTTMLAIPALMSEKFTARVLLCTVGAVLLYVALIPVSDILVNCIFYVFSQSHQWMGMLTPYVYKPLLFNDFEGVKLFAPGEEMASLCLIGFFFFNYAFYLLASALFRKVPAVMALLIQIVVGIILAIVLTYAVTLTDFDADFMVTHSNVQYYQLMVFVVLLGLTALEVWWAYRLFKGITVIKTRKIGL